MRRVLVVLIIATLAIMALCSCSSVASNVVERAKSESLADTAANERSTFAENQTDLAQEDDGADDESDNGAVDRPDEGVREIVCWGDSLTKGDGASLALITNDELFFDASYLSYPEILEQLTGIPTYNFGVSGATSQEIANMQSGLQDETFLQKLNTVKEIKDVKKVVRQGRKHPGDVLVLEIGSNGGWSDYGELIEQYRAMIAHSGCDDYIILGDTDDPGTSEADLDQEPFPKGEGTNETAWETALREAFGHHFINMRLALVEHGLEVAGLEATEKDAKAASRGRVSRQLRTDWTHLNSYGYYAQAMFVYLKGQELGYW